jgi:hypothetical protein
VTKGERCDFHDLEVHVKSGQAKGVVANAIRNDALSTAGSRSQLDPIIANAIRNTTVAPAGSPTVTSAPAGNPESTRFDWGDSGVGAAGATGLILLAGGLGLAVRKRNTLAHSHS